MITVGYISTNGDCIFACENAAGTSFNTFMTINNNPMFYVASIVFHMDWSFKSVPDPHLRTVQYL
jgi:hypothetical protein